MDARRLSQFETTQSIRTEPEYSFLQSPNSNSRNLTPSKSFTTNNSTLVQSRIQAILNKKKYQTEVKQPDSPIIKPSLGKVIGISASVNKILVKIFPESQQLDTIFHKVQDATLEISKYISALINADQTTSNSPSTPLNK